MNATAILSTTAHRRLVRARAWLHEFPPSQEALLIGATLDAVNELARHVAAEKGASFGWHRMTLPQLVSAIAAPALASKGLAPVSRLGAEALVTRVVHRLKQDIRLGRFAPVAATPGFPKALAGVLSELRLARLASEDLTTVAPDLVPLIEAVEREMADAGLVDWAGILEIAIDTVSSGSPPRLARLPTLLLDVPIGTEAERVFLGALAQAAPSMLATVPTSDRATFDRMRATMPWSVDALDGDTEKSSSPALVGLSRLQQNLFSEDRNLGEVASDSSVSVFSAPGEDRECVEIARRVLALARQDIPFDRIAVLLRSPVAYRDHLQEAFARAQIPAHFARGAVRPDPAGRAFLALLKCAADGLSARRFAEYLSLGQVPDADATGAPPEAQPRGERWVSPDSELVPGIPTETIGAAGTPPDLTKAESERTVASGGRLRAPPRWERLLVEAAVIGGRDRWRRRIDGLGNELRLRLAEVGEEDESHAAALKRALDDLSAFAGYALPLVEELDALPVAADWGDWLDRLSALATRSLRQPDRVLAVLAELDPLAPVGPISLAEVLAALEGLLSEVSVPPSLSRYGKVFVGPVETARGLGFAAVFVPGLAEKMFPSKIVEEPILLDAMRNALGGDLLTNQGRLDAERLALALAVGAAEGRICFSYPRIDLTEARPRVPSFYALETIRAAEGRLPDFAELGRRAETSTATRLGWPAPTKAADAIDDAEHDLAILDQIAAGPAPQAGVARYLVTANAHLARALRARYQRWGSSWTSADGMTSQSEVSRAIMARHTLGARSYSPTALQNYSRCPYRFFLQAVHGLAPREIPEAIDEIDPLQRGSIIHDVQFKLFAHLRDEGLLPVKTGNLDRARVLLDQTMSDAATRYRDELAPAIDRVWEDGIAAIHADLREWLRRASEDDSGYIPWRFELSFGLEGRSESRLADPLSVPGAVSLDCGIQLRGSIDLVERHPNGAIRVTDHKSGKAAAPRQLVDGGKTLQPLLYPLAAEKLFAGEGRVVAGRLYFCTSAGAFSERVVPLNGQAREIALQLAETIGEALAQPFLPAAPEKGQCELCEYRVVCGPYEERRTARKPREQLEPLFALRGLP